jgi:hypothetical protein
MDVNSYLGIYDIVAVDTNTADYEVCVLQKCNSIGI